MMKMGAIAPLALKVFETAGFHLREQPARDVWSWFAIYFYAYPVYLYLNFSGYTDIAIGTARLLGFRLPENFNQPYLARNVNDFWNRWHISLTHWIRDYVFMTSYKAAAERFPRRKKTLGYACLFMALFLAGVWHGAAGGFVVFGMLHGVGSAVSQLYGDNMKRRLGISAFQRYQQNRVVEYLAILLTFHFVCLTLLFFSSGIGGAWNILRKVGRQVTETSWSGSVFPLGVIQLAVIVVVVLGLGTLWLRLMDYPVLWKEAASMRSMVFLKRAVAIKSVLVVLVLLAFWALNEKDAVVAYVRF